MDKWDYIEKIRKCSTNNRDELSCLMDRYNKCNLRDITFNEVKTYYEEISTLNS